MSEWRSCVGALLELTELVGQSVEAALPEAAVVLEVGRRELERDRVQVGRPLLGGPATGDEACLLQDLQVLRDRLEADPERRRQLPHRCVAEGEPGEDLSASGIGKG